MQARDFLFHPSGVHIIERLQEHGHEAVFAGGCVRDMIMGFVPSDWDIATSATPDEVERIFEKTIPVGKSFGVVRVHVSGEEFEVATFRKDVGSDGRRPILVEFSSMELDASRRDFTINAMFVDPISGKVFDFFGGTDDIRNERLRFVGEPEARIQEDFLRIFRMIRFVSKLGMTLAHDFEHMKEIVRRNSDGIRSISAERINVELTKMFTHENAHLAFQMLFDLGIWEIIVPEIHVMWDTEQDSKWHPEGSVGIHTGMLLKHAGRNLRNNPLLAWGIILHDVGKRACNEVSILPNGHRRVRSAGHAMVGSKMSTEILGRLRFDSDTISRVRELVFRHMDFFNVLNMKKATLSKFCDFKDFDTLLELHRCDSLASGDGTDLTFFNFINEFISSTPTEEIKLSPLINGRDLISLGLKPGIQFAEILELVRDEQRSGSIKTKDEAIDFIRENFLNNQ